MSEDKDHVNEHKAHCDHCGFVTREDYKFCPECALELTIVV